MSQSEIVPFDEGQSTLNRSAPEEVCLQSGNYWGQLRVFLAVAKCLSFNAAADLLHMSQPTVSRNISRLQDVMGVQLVHSSTKGISLTRRGEQLAESLAEFDHSMSSMASQLSPNNIERVDITVTDALGALFLVPQLSELNIKQPSISVNIKDPINMLEFEENHSDIMIGFAPQERSIVISRQLGCIHFLPVASHGYIQQFGLPTIAVMEHHRFIHSELYASNNSFWNSWKNLIEMGTIAHMSDNSFTYAMMVKLGLGIGLLGSYTTIERGFVALDLDVRIPVQINIFASKERMKSKSVRIVFDWICKIFQFPNPWFGAELHLGHTDDTYSKGFKVLFNLD